MSKKNQPHIALDSFWPYQAIVLADHVSRYTLSVVRAKAGLNLSQWRVLAAVADVPGRTAAEVTAVTPMDKTIVSRAVTSLIAAGLVKKTPNSSDKRRHSLMMTASGAAIYKKIAALLNAAMVESLKDGTSPDDFVATLKEFSTKMTRISR